LCDSQFINKIRVLHYTRVIGVSTLNYTLFQAKSTDIFH